jgi:hypothetical protein
MRKADSYPYWCRCPSALERFKFSLMLEEIRTDFNNNSSDSRSEMKNLPTQEYYNLHSLRLVVGMK